MGGSSGGIIVGGGDLIQAVFERIGKVADFRRARLIALHTLYLKDEDAITPEDQQFIFRCAADVVEHL